MYIYTYCICTYFKMKTTAVPAKEITGEVQGFDYTLTELALYCITQARIIIIKNSP